MIHQSFTHQNFELYNTYLHNVATYIYIYIYVYIYIYIYIYIHRNLRRYVPEGHSKNDRSIEATFEQTVTGNSLGSNLCECFRTIQEYTEKQIQIV